MTIRFATMEDIPALVLIGKRMHAITRFRCFEYNEEKVAKSLRNALERAESQYVCFVAEDSAKNIVGGLLAVTQRQIFSDLLIASVMQYVVLPERRMGGHGLRLLKAFEKWAENRRVAEIAFGINSGIESENIGKFARKVGFVKVGDNLVRRCAGLTMTVTDAVPASAASSSENIADRVLWRL